MLVNSIEIKVKKKDAMRHLLRKTPLFSKIDQFNRKVENIHLEYVEYKVLKYEIIEKKKNINNFRCQDTKHTITMMVNTYNGHSQSVDILPKTIKRYIARDCIKKSNIKDEYIVKRVTSHIMEHLDNINNGFYFDKTSIKSINIIEISSIYKPYWIGEYNGKNIFYPA